MEAWKQINPLTLSGLAQVNHWRRSHGLPQNAFFKGLNGLAVNGGKGWQSGVDNIINKSNEVRMRKPHFVDFRNPFLCRVLQTQLDFSSRSQVVFEECVPDMSQYKEGGQTASAEEYIYQLDLAW